MTDTLERREAVLEARNKWLVDALHYAIQFHVYAEASRDDVAKVVDSLSDSDEYDENVAALVQMPKWCSPSEAQDAVDRALSLPAREVSGNDVEASAWAWLDQTFGSESDDPVDRAYAADEMVDAFHAGRAALATTPAPREMEADLVELAKEMLENLKHCSLDSGCCHCGDSMDRHSDPMHCGHTPVDMGWTASANWIAKAETTLAKLDRLSGEG